MAKIRKLTIKINGEISNRWEVGEGNEIKEIELLDDNDETIFHLY